jgi:hypothetical protein
MHQHDQTGGALHQRAHGAGAPGTEDEIALPVPRHQAALNLLRPLLDVGHVAELAAPFGTLRLAASHWLGLAQIGQQLAPQLAARQGVERSVERLVRDPQTGRLLHAILNPFAPTRDLLRRPTKPQ